MVVSEICLGTMTFGSWCNEKESFAILDHAFDHGIDFFDTAELYPVPPHAKWANKTEEIFGKWLKTKNRDAVIVATKVAGPGHGWFRPPVRTGKTGLDRHHIKKAIEGSLRRLQTDYIDLYQTHWPDLWYPYEQTLLVLDELQKEGKIRYSGCSNDTAYGLTKSLWAADKHGLQRFESIQNNYSILCRRSEIDVIEVCRREEVSLLPYSPLGGGVLTGKYNTEPLPADARYIDYVKGDKRQKSIAAKYLNPSTLNATAELMYLAAELKTNATALSIAWASHPPVVASTIIGARSKEQLDQSLQAVEISLNRATLKKIDKITNKYPDAIVDS